jgi:hypothetical protein
MGGPTGRLTVGQSSFGSRLLAIIIIIIIIVRTLFDFAH